MLDFSTIYCQDLCGYKNNVAPYCQSERLHNHFPAVRTSEDYRVCEVHSKDDNTKIN